MTIASRLLGIPFILVVLLWPDHLAADTLLIRNVRVIDGTGAKPTEPLSILIEDGRIAGLGVAVDVGSPAIGVRELDAGGGFAIPGLIDSHVHLTYGPGSGVSLPAPTNAKEWRSGWGKRAAHYLRAYLASGVTTVLDAGGQDFAIREIQGLLASGAPGPRYLNLGPFLRPPDGYPDPAFESVSGRRAIRDAVEGLVSLGSVGVKVPIEEGFSPIGSIPIHLEEDLQSIFSEARAHGLPVFVHATEERHQRIAIEMGARALMHPIIGPGPGREEELSDGFVEAMRASGAFQVSTLSVTDTQLRAFDGKGLSGEPLIDLVVPAAELARARSKEAGAVAQVALLEGGLRWVPRFILRFMAGAVFTEETLDAALGRSARAIAKLQEAGVPIVVGSDSPFNPEAGIYAFHGPTTLTEIELLVNVAGLSPHQAIRSATRVPAEMLGISDEVGTIAVGLQADLLIIPTNPLNDIGALRAPSWVIQAGVAKTPTKWMGR